MDKLVTKLVMFLMFLMYFQYGMDGSTVPCARGWWFWISTGIAMKVNPYVRTGPGARQREHKVVWTACDHGL